MGLASDPGSRDVGLGPGSYLANGRSALGHGERGSWTSEPGRVEDAQVSAATKVLAELDRVKAHFGDGSGARKLAHLAELVRSRLPTATAVHGLHEILCFLRAHPDDELVLTQVTAMLDGFDRRIDLRQHRKALADTGIAGTSIHFGFFANTARWLAKRFPGALRVDWNGYAKAELLSARLPLLATWSETPGLDEIDWPMRQWVKRLAGSNVSDADFLIERCARLGRNEAERDAFWEELDLTLELRPGATTPSRSRAVFPRNSIHYQQEPLRRERPELSAELKRKAQVREVDERTGAELIALARDAMVVRHRDLDAFSFGDPRDVRIYSCGRGLEFAVIGMRPDRRLLLESVYAYLTLVNGVPIGYVLTSGLFASSEIAYNVFDTWRGGEAGLVYVRVLGVTRQLYGSDTFTIYPYQLGGEGNDEGLKSGAWWFYQKLGFRARDPEVLALMNQELATMQRDTSHRTSIATLKKLAAHNVYWSPGKVRDDVIGVFPLSEVGLAITDSIAARFGADRERGERVCAEEAAKLCGIRGWQRWDAGERLAWIRWSPLILVLPGVADWPAADRARLAAVARAKGGRRESDYVKLLDGHARLRRALRAIGV